MTDEQLKFCPRCHTYKQKSGFYKNRSRRDGLSHYCKTCMVEYNVNHRRDKRERERAAEQAEQ